MSTRHRDGGYAHFWREVAYQAVRDLLLESEATAEERELARRFVFDDARGMGSFVWACEQGGLDPEAVRQELRERGVAC